MRMEKMAENLGRLLLMLLLPSLFLHRQSSSKLQKKPWQRYTRTRILRSKILSSQKNSRKKFRALGRQA